VIHLLMLWCRAETIAEPYYTFLRKGYNVDMASIAGGRIPIDPLSVEPPRMKTHSVKLMLTDRASPPSGRALCNARALPFRKSREAWCSGSWVLVVACTSSQPTDSF
jgi:hypothetical protein